MNVNLKRSIATCIIFGLLFLFLVLYFVLVGPTSFLDSKLHMVITSIAIALALASFGMMILFTTKKSNLVDERDYMIQRKASSVGLMSSLMYVFLLSIILFVAHRNDGALPVSWLWFIAYSTFAFGYFFTSLMNIFYYNYEE